MLGTILEKKKKSIKMFPFTAKAGYRVLLKQAEKCQVREKRRERILVIYCGRNHSGDFMHKQWSEHTDVRDGEFMGGRRA